MQGQRPTQGAVAADGDQAADAQLLQAGEHAVDQLPGQSSRLAVAGRVSPLWLLALYFLQTCGELCLSPVGLSTFTKLSPAKYVGAMLGVWFLAAAFGNKFAGVLASAFGEGVNIPDIRHVVLFHVPFNDVEFNQMCGRAGRDGALARIHLLFGGKDARVNELILSSLAPARDDLATLSGSEVAGPGEARHLRQPVALIHRQLPDPAEQQDDAGHGHGPVLDPRHDVVAADLRRSRRAAPSAH